MISSMLIPSLVYNDKEVEIEFSIPDICPRCHKGIAPYAVDGVYYENSNKSGKMSMLYYCQLCKSCFMTTYDVHTVRDNRGYIEYKAYENGVSEPISYVGKIFSTYITGLSSKFVEIYNQSENAEALNLSHIAGMGYRKALEFLVKDFAIHQNPDKQNEIERTLLSNCIRDYIDNPKIQTLAERTAWLGNDETHYLKKHTDRDITDLKSFINACANYIEMELTLEDAETVPRLN